MNTDSLLGKQFDEYQIDQPLGSGGMARVYRALDTRLKRYVALKVIAPDFRTDSDYHFRFEREAQSIARLEHPNIVRIYRFGDIGGMYYMAMEYIEGADLGWLIRDYKKDGEVMPLDSISRLLTEIGAALDYAHSKQVIHRDVKPGNIILDKSGRAVLTDFGLALLADIGTRGEILGSPHYIAPEQAISSGNVVPQSDLYSLGVTLFEMLTGELPFSDGEPMDIAMRHVSEPPPLPSTFNTAIPQSVDEVVLRVLAKEPSDRYITGAELSAAFQRAITGWQPPSPLATDVARRPSLVAAPDKIHERMVSTALPILPPTPPNVEPEFTRAATTMAHRAEARTQPARAPEPVRTQRSWLYPMLFAIAIFSVGVIGLLVVLAPRNNGAVVLSALPTLTSTVPPLEPSATEIQTFTATSLPTFLSSPTALILPNTTSNATDVIATSLPSITPSDAVPVTPSVKTLVIRSGKDWVAFVNTSSLPLSLAGFQIRQEERSLSGIDWGKSILMPGECLRIYSKNPPKDLPKDCTLPFDYQGNKKDLDHWIKDNTTVVVNPSTEYCYPKCND